MRTGQRSPSRPPATLFLSSCRRHQQKGLMEDFGRFGIEIRWFKRRAPEGFGRAETETRNKKKKRGEYLPRGGLSQWGEPEGRASLV